MDEADCCAVMACDGQWQQVATAGHKAAGDFVICIPRVLFHRREAVQ